MIFELTKKEENEAIEIAKDLIRIPSSIRYGNSIYDHVKRLLIEKGHCVKTQTIENPNMNYSDFTNLYCITGNGNGPKIMINGHLDTVAEVPGFFYPPFSGIDEGNKIYGVGAADMKGGCAAAITAFDAFLKHKKNFNGELFLSFVFGEEEPDNLGADTLIQEYDLKKYDLIIIPEPSPLLAVNDHCITHQKIHRSSFPAVIVGAEGRVILEIEVFGRSAHPSHPSLGINALHDISKIIYELDSFDIHSNIKMGRGHFCVLGIQGGTPTYSVPDYCKITVNRNLTIGETVRSVTKEIFKLIKSLKLRSQIKVTPILPREKYLEYSPYLFQNSHYIEKFIDNMKEYYNSKNEKPLPKKICRFTTKSVGDFNYFAARTKVPTLVFGPGGGNIHSANEFVNKDEIIQTSNYLFNFLMNTF